MTSLSARLEAIDYSKQFRELEEVLNTYQPKITFWGGSVIEAADKKESVYLDAVVQKVNNAARARCDADDLEPGERKIGLRIVKKLDEFYWKVDEQVKGLNFLTRFFYNIRNFSFIPYTPRFYLGEMAPRYFRAFSEKKFAQLFGPFVRHAVEGTKGYLTHPESDGSFGPPLRWCVREEKIEVLADR